MHETDVQPEARLHAIEYLLANLYAKFFLQIEDEAMSEVDHGIARMLQGLDTVTIPGVDPIASDVVAGELRDAVERLLQMIREMVAAGIRLR